MRQPLALALLAILVLGACGTKGSLTLPPVPATPVAAATPQPAANTKSDTATAKDSSTPVEPVR
ncbi:MULTISPECIES: LPS translocon maturation chaperone LptM [Candidatus Accumulibacter]|uniref:LPS translocon maturation chaperone LptM n=1 Tax=Candidatus Accumulibacter TaxID=327159 RepID=UPI00110A97B0|nr:MULTISPECIES: lipoprotein [Candidatus Accumulibacter]MCC2866180.1 lipoprotein [Candidatus Accumulibacter phosphatis]MCM8620484.1 lipoprotein [Accumulibacter sp.]